MHAVPQASIILRRAIGQNAGNRRSQGFSKQHGAADSAHVHERARCIQYP
jgi:hypothetical protein